MATELQFNRYNSGIKNNSDIKKHLALSPAVRQLLITATNRLNLSAQSYLTAIKVAHTIANLNNSPDITTRHIGKVLQYRQNT